MTSVKRHRIPFEDPRLGRHVVHDPKSWDYQEKLPRRTTPLKSVQHRRYDPMPEPNQQIGCCTFVSECMLANTKGNRVMGEVLNMEDAEHGYSLATSIDPFEGTYPPVDTGSSGLAAAKAAVQLGIADNYVWYFSVEDVLLGLQKHPISFGGNWYGSMFAANEYNPLIGIAGNVAGGHQWVLSGYKAKDELIVGECWWGASFGYNGRFYLPVNDFRRLMDEDGDAHYTYRKGATG
jgi:hypothetical protein